MKGLSLVHTGLRDLDNFSDFFFKITQNALKTLQIPFLNHPSQVLLENTALSYVAPSGKISGSGKNRHTKFA